MSTEVNQFLRGYVLTFFILTISIYVPIGIYFTWKYYQHRHNIVLQKRYAKVTLVQNIFLIILIPSAMSSPAAFNLTGPILPFNLYSVFIACSIGLVYCMLTRLWMYYFDIMYDHSVHEHDWEYILNGKHQIDDTIQQTTTNFFVKHKDTLGNYKFISKILTVCWLIFAVGGLFLNPPWKYYTYSDEDRQSSEYQTRLAINTAITVSFAFIPCIIIAIVRYKTPIFNDRLLIRTEFKYMLYTLYTGFAAIVIGIIIYLLVDQEIIEDVVTTTIYIYIATVAIVVLLISTYWVLKQMRPYLTDIESIVSSTKSSTTKNDKSIGEDMRLVRVFMNDALFYDFVNHLRFEFSLELLMAFYEMVFFQNWIKRSYPEIESRLISQNGDNDADGKENVTVSGNENNNKSVYEFSDSLPKPAKTWKGDEEKTNYADIKNAAYYIFSQYIATGCDLEINIPYHLHNKYELLMGDEEEWKKKTIEELSIDEIYKLYQESIDELFKLLSHSFNRFKKYDVVRLQSISLELCAAGSHIEFE